MRRGRCGEAVAAWGQMCWRPALSSPGGADKLRKMNVPVRTLISFEGH